MGGKGSGRRPTPLGPGVVLPGIGETEESIRSYIAAVAAAVVDPDPDCRLDPRFADTLIGAAKAALHSIDIRKSRDREATVKGWLEEVKALRRSKGPVASPDGDAAGGPASRPDGQTEGAATCQRPSISGPSTNSQTS